MTQPDVPPVDPLRKPGHPVVPAPPTTGQLQPYTPQSLPYPQNYPQPHPSQHQGPPVVHHVHHVPVVGQKSLGLAVVLWIFLGGLGVDQFYLGRVGSGLGILGLNVLGWLTFWFFLGYLFWGALLVWAIVNVCLLPGQVARHNAALAAAWGARPPFAY